MQRNYAAERNPSRNPNFSRRWTEPTGRSDQLDNDAARRAAKHWLTQADLSDGDTRTACLTTADAVLRLAGLRWGDLVGRAP